jgi:hypothetical protein
MFISDAAGAAQPASTLQSPDRGVASLGFQNTDYFFASILYWPHPFLQLFPSNSTLLEAIGLLLPFLAIPLKLRGQNVQLFVDNEAVVHAWNRRVSARNEWISLVIQTLHVLEAALPCRIHVQHIPRCSTKPARLVDALSRKCTTTPAELQQIAHLTQYQPQGPLLEWLQDPHLDWTLPLRISQYVQEQL